MSTSVKNRVLVIVLALVMMVTAFAGMQAINAAPAEATYDRSCYPWGGFTYHKHWNWAGSEWWHGSDHFPSYNDFYYYDRYYSDWDYRGWDWCY